MGLHSFLLVFFALHENDRLVGSRGRQVLFFAIEQLELFFGEASGAEILFSVVEVAAIRIRIHFLHGNYMI